MVVGTTNTWNRVRWCFSKAEKLPTLAMKYDPTSRISVGKKESRVEFLPGGWELHRTLFGESAFCGHQRGTIFTAGLDGTIRVWRHQGGWFTLVRCQEALNFFSTSKLCHCQTDFKRFLKPLSGFAVCWQSWIPPLFETPSDDGSGWSRMALCC